MPIIREILVLTLLECVTQLCGEVKVTPKIFIISVHTIGELSIVSNNTRSTVTAVIVLVVALLVVIILEAVAVV